MTLPMQPLQTSLQKAERERETFVKGVDIFSYKFSRGYINVRKVRNVHNV